MKIRLANIVLALIFAASGIAKLLALPFEVAAFARWGYPPLFMTFTGVLEVAGAMGLLLPRLSALASACLFGLMLGAIGTHILHQEWPMLVLAMAIAALAAWRTYLGRAEIRQLWARSS